MPLTDFQKGVARLIATNRKPESHIAGGAVLNRGEAALRISNDLDIFHDALEEGRKVTEIVRGSLFGAWPTITRDLAYGSGGVDFSGAASGPLPT